jgi:hypothetical protein
MISISRFFVLATLFTLFVLALGGCASVNAPGGTLRRYPFYTEVNMPQEGLERCQMQRTEQAWQNLQMAAFARQNGVWFQIPWSQDNDAFCRSWMIQQFGGQGLQFNGGGFGFPGFFNNGFGNGANLMPAAQSPLYGDFAVSGPYASPLPVIIDNGSPRAVVAAPIGQVTLSQHLDYLRQQTAQNTRDIDGLSDGVFDLYRRRR